MKKTLPLIIGLFLYQAPTYAYLCPHHISIVKAGCSAPNTYDKEGQCYAAAIKVLETDHFTISQLIYKMCSSISYSTKYNNEALCYREAIKASGDGHLKSISAGCSAANTYKAQTDCFEPFIKQLIN